MTFNVITQASASAPICNSTKGSLISILDYGLVNGVNGVAPLGLSKPYYDAASNRAVYRLSTVSGTGFYICVDDNYGPYALLRGAEAMTDYDIANGTNLFPTIAQKSTTTYGIHKSDQWEGNTSARNWIIVGDEQGFVCHIYAQAAGSSVYGDWFYFGDGKSRFVADPYRCVIGAARAPTNWISNSWNVCTYSKTADFFAARSYNGVGTSIQIALANGLFIYPGVTASDLEYIDGRLTYPDPAGKTIIQPMRVMEGQYIVRMETLGIATTQYYGWLFWGAPPSDPISSINGMPDVTYTFKRVGSNVSGDSNGMLLIQTSAWPNPR